MLLFQRIFNYPDNADSWNLTIYSTRCPNYPVTGLVIARRTSRHATELILVNYASRSSVTSNQDPIQCASIRDRKGNRIRRSTQIAEVIGQNISLRVTGSRVTEVYALRTEDLGARKRTKAT